MGDRKRTDDLANHLRIAIKASAKIQASLNNLENIEVDDIDLVSPKVRQLTAQNESLNDELYSFSEIIKSLEHKLSVELDCTDDEAEDLRLRMNDDLKAMNEPDRVVKTNMPSWKYIEKYFPPSTLVDMYNEGMRKRANALRETFIQHFADIGGIPPFAEYSEQSSLPISNWEGVNSYQ